MQMRIPSAGRAGVTALAGLLLIAATLSAPPALALGDAPVPAPAKGAAAKDPQDQAKLTYNLAVDDVRKADDFQTSAATATDAGKKDKALGDARTYYSLALRKFQQAVQFDPKMYQAWNYVGYTHRKLGDYDDALGAYEQALALKPGYPEAIEYRAEAFLALNRIPEAKTAYLDLFATNRVAAGKLLDAMKTWVTAQKSSAGSDQKSATDLDKWVQERSQIASQTAGLTRQGTFEAWR
ncbi:MAG TPA: tetratricopeptide repeat protein [Steroidobacteraceae bacterium]|jgi:tetratricopeptide (TPR) repeat protein